MLRGGVHVTEINTVVYPTDFSDLSLISLPLAKRLAATFDAQLHCLYVVQEPTVYSSLDMGTIPLPTSDELTEAANKSLKRFAEEHLDRSDGQSHWQVAQQHQRRNDQETTTDADKTGQNSNECSFDRNLPDGR